MNQTSTSPSVVTFMELAGAAPLWARDPETMRAAVAVFDDIVRARLIAFDGPTPQAMGAGHLLVWPNPTRAVRFLLSVQEGLTAASWPAALLEQPEAAVVHGSGGAVVLAGLRCRMAAHIGPVRTTESGLVDGLAVRRAARVASAAHGGQVLVTLPVNQALDASTGGDLTVRALGARPLRGVRGSVHLFDVRSPATAGRTFAPPRTRDVEKSNLRLARDAFVGRSADRSAVSELLAFGVRCVALVGPSGRGRGRLASALIERPEGPWTAEDGGGAWVLRLDRRPTVESLLVEVGSALDIDLSNLTGASDAAQQVARILAGSGPLLLVLRGVDEWSDELLAVLDAWLRRVPKLQVLTTSTHPIRLQLAVSYRLGPLSTRRGGMRSGAARLLLRRIREHGGAVADLPHEVVGRLLDLSGGSPLALELLAGQIVGRPIEEVLAQLQQKDTSDPIGAALAVCMGHLPAWMRGALERLSVIDGPFTLGTAAAVASLGDWVAAPAPADALLLMVERGLVHRSWQAEQPGVARFVLHDAIRERIAARGSESDLDEAAMRYARHALTTAVPWVEDLHGDHGDEALAVLSDSRHMLRSALETGLVRALDEREGLAMALDALLALDGLLTRQGLPETHETYLDRAIALAEQAEQTPPQLVKLLRARGRVRYLRSGTRGAREDLERSRQLGQDLGDKEGEGVALGALGQLLASRGEMARAVDCLTEALTLLVTVDTPRETALVRAALGSALTRSGDARGAEAHLAAAVRGFRAGDDTRSEALARMRLGTCCRRLGKLSEARKHLLAALEAHEGFGQDRRAAEALEQLGAVEAQQGMLRDAVHTFDHALRRVRELGEHRVAARVACRLGMVYVEIGDMDKARDAFNEGMALSTDVRSASVTALAHAGLGMIIHAAGRPDRAIEHYRQASYSMSGRGEPRLQTAVLSLWATCAAELGATDESTQSLHAVVARMRSANDTWVDHTGTLCQQWVRAETTNWTDQADVKVRALLQGLKDLPDVPIVVRAVCRVANARLQRATFQTG